MTSTAQTLTRDSIAAIVRESTLDEHRAAEERPFIRDLMGGQLSLADYTRYLAQFARVYEALESRPTSAGDPAFFDAKLARFASIQHDLAALDASDWRTSHPALPSTDLYVSHLNAIPSDDVVRWTAHYYTRYLGDLSGGQAIARLVARNYGATSNQLSFFDFSALGDDLVPYKRGYREALDRLNLTDPELDILVAEVKVAYALNSSLFDELGG